VLEKHFARMPGDVVRVIHSDYNIDGAFRVVHRSLRGASEVLIDLELKQISDCVYDTNYETTAHSWSKGQAPLSTTGGELLYFPAYADKTGVSVDEHVALVAVRIAWGNGLGAETPLVTDAQDATNYDCKIAFDPGTPWHITVQLAGGGSGKDWTTVVRANTQGLMYVRVQDTVAQVSNEIVAFAHYSHVSNTSANAYTALADVRVMWGDGLGQEGLLVTDAQDPINYDCTIVFDPFAPGKVIVDLVSAFMIHTGTGRDWTADWVAIFNGNFDTFVSLWEV
jgi:hypothetical protein